MNQVGQAGSTRERGTGADFLQLDPSGAPPRGLAGWLAAALRAGMADGRLAAGSRLPASRTLATQLGVSRGVVVEAYQRLADEGLVGGRAGGGTTVLATAPTRATAAPPTGHRPATTRARHPASTRCGPAATAPAAPGPADPAPTGRGAGHGTDDERPPVKFDLSPGLPDLSAFPRQAWLRAERATLATLTAADLGYGDPRGAAGLRHTLAGWLARTRGIRADPGDLIVVSGVAQAIALLAQVLRERGLDRIGFEDPGSHSTRQQALRWGLRVRPVPVDVHGLDVAALAATGVDSVFVTPAHQFPTGVVLAPQRRRLLAEWADGGGLVIEDDYDAEHRYDRPPVAALHALAPERVVHTGSVSKTLAPALRLGWLLAPSWLRADLVERKRRADLSGPVLGQLALAHLIGSGAFDRHLRLVRARHRARRDALLGALAAHVPGARVHGVAAGLHLLVTLPGLDDTAVAADALDAGVAVQPLSMHRMRPGPPGLVIGYAATTPDRLLAAVRVLAGVIGQAVGRPAGGPAGHVW